MEGAEPWYSPARSWLDCLPMDTQVVDPMLGALVGGRYRVKARVARGGAATVYTAVDERLGRTVAVKVIHPAQPYDPRFLDRFADEANAIARLTHPNVVAVYDQGVHQVLDPGVPGGTRDLPYLVMEYVRGRTLREVLAERRRLQPVEALAIMEQVLAAIAAAHRNGLLHRDVKPENVLVAEAPSGGMANLVDSVVKVADFGLARALAASAQDPAGGQLMATVAYVAPELVTTGHADPRTDVYAAGIVLFEVLTGRVPFDGDRPAEVAWQHVDQDVPPPSRYVPALPAVLDLLVARVTRRDPAARPTDAGAMLAEVQQARENLGTATPSSPADATTTLRPTDAPTMMVPMPPGAFGGPQGPAEPGARPTWARLPQYGSATGGAPAPALTERLARFSRGLRGSSGARTALIASLAVVALVVTVCVWWFGFGRYTQTPALVGLPQDKAVASARSAGFTVIIGDGEYREDKEKDVVLAQQPAVGERVVKGTVITLTLSLGPNRINVPDVVGQAFADAKSELESKKLKVVRGGDQYDATVPVGNVMAVKPAVDTEVKPGTKVTLTVSKGPPPVTVPEVIGQHIDQVRGPLQQLGLVVNVEQVDSPDQPAGTVLDQEPKPGAGVERNTHIKLKVSRGQTMVTIPRVIDRQCEQAKQMLQGMGLHVEVQGKNQAVVRGQDPSENTQVPPGTRVRLICE